MSEPRTRYHHGDLRTAVLRQAEETLRVAGVDSLSLRQIARDVGVSNAAPRRHFRDKQALLDSLAVEGFNRLGAEFDRVPRSDGPLIESLYALAEAYIRFAVENSSLLGLMFSRKHSLSSDADIEGSVGDAFAIPISVIAAAQQRGEVVAGDPQRIGMSAISALQGLATFVGSGFVNRETADQLLRETITHLMQGLRPRT